MKKAGSIAIILQNLGKAETVSDYVTISMSLSTRTLTGGKFGSKVHSSSKQILCIMSYSGTCFWHIRKVKMKQNG